MRLNLGQNLGVARDGVRVGYAFVTGLKIAWLCKVEFGNRLSEGAVHASPLTLLCLDRLASVRTRLPIAGGSTEA